jgi:hypothetical protein
MTHVNELIGPVHNSHLTAIRRCKNKFKYAYIEGIQPRMPALPLARGIWIHYCLEAQFTRWGLEDGTLLIPHGIIQVDGVGAVVIDPSSMEMLVPDEEAEEGIAEYPLSASGMLQLLTEQVWSHLFPEEHEKYTEDNHTLPEAVERILTEYFYFYREQFTNRTFKILLVEVAWKRAYKGQEFEGRADYVIQMDSGLIVCGDWKSTKREPHAEYKFMESQLHLYPWGIAPMLEELGVDREHIEMMAVEFDYLSTKLPTTPSQNKDGSISKRKINTTYLTLGNALREYGLKWSEEQIEEFLARNEKEFFIRKRLPRGRKVIRTLLDENLSDSEDIVRLVEGGVASRTVTHNCSWDCDFMELCKGELYGQNMSKVRKTQYEPRTNSHAGVVEKDD